MNKENTENVENKTDSDNTETKTFTEWLDTQPDELKEQIQPLFDTEIAGLKSTVNALRDERKKQDSILQDAIKKADEGSELKKQLLDYEKSIKDYDRQLAFWESAQGAGCNNVKLAWLVATSGDLFSRDGSADWETIRKEAPELFIKKPDNGAGSGTGGNPPTTKRDMNDWIRRQVQIK